MLAQAISKVQLLVEQTRQKLSQESVAVMERLYRDVVNLNKFIKKKMVEVENDQNLDPIEKRAAKRKVFEQAERKLEVLKDKRNYSKMIEKIELKMENGAEQQEASILKFLQQREVRDRLAGMTEAQILSHFGGSLFDGSNELLLDAILNAPPGFEILSEEIRSNLGIIKAKKIYPNMIDKIDAVQALKSRTMQLFTLIKEQLDNLRLKELPESIIKKA